MAEMETMMKKMMQFMLEENAKLNKDLVSTSKESSSATIMDSLHKRIPAFHFDQEAGETFGKWHERYRIFIEEDGKALDDFAKVRFLTSKLEKSDFDRFITNLLPKKVQEVTYIDAVKLLKDLFQSEESLFRKRYKYHTITRGNMELVDLIGMIKQRHASAQIASMSDEQTMCQTLVNALSDPKDRDLKARCLARLEKGEVTIGELYRELQFFVQLQKDTEAASSSGVMHVQGQGRTANNHRKRSPPSPCPRCKGNHWARDCPKRNVRGKPRYQQSTHSQNRTLNKHRPVKYVSSRDTTIPSIYKTVHINGTPIRMLLDTGAAVTLLSKADWVRLGTPKLGIPTMHLSAANGGEITVHGILQCRAQFNGKTFLTKCHITDHCSLLGMDWIAEDPEIISALQGPSSPIKTVTFTSRPVTEESLLTFVTQRYPDVFQDGIGRCTKLNAVLKLRENTTKVFRKARPVAYAVLPLVHQELDRLQEAGIISPVEHSDFAAPVVVVRKTNGKLRLCGDYSTGLNDALEDNKHPLPTAEDIFTTLNGGKYFSQIDLTDAYLQIEMEETSRKLLTINTVKGLFTMNRLPFGVKTAPAIFQNVMDNMINGLNGVAAYLDDIVIMGKTIEEHNERLLRVLDRIKEYGLRLKLDKCTFLKREIKYLGFIITAEGRKPDPERIQAILTMPAPTCITEVRSLLGMLTFYGSFIPQMNDLKGPLNELLKKDTVFEWSPNCENVLEKSKKILSSGLLLVHYDPNLPLIVAADASQNGIGGVLLQKFEDGSMKAVQHFSRSLTPTERKYSQIEKEALALVSAVKKFHKFIYGRKFTLNTDHKPLISIFGSKKGVPAMSANRLQRWAVILLGYDFEIKYKNTKDFGEADALSRLIDSKQNNQEEIVIASIEKTTSEYLSKDLRAVKLSTELLKRETLQDKVLQDAIRYIETSEWPELPKDSPLIQLFHRRHGLSVVDDCVMFGENAVIPLSLQKRILTELHKGHPGINRMKQLARSYVYWQGIDAQIEDCVKVCEECQQASKLPPKEPLSPWTPTDRPWSRVHIDFAGPLKGHHYLIMVDSYSKWPEVIKMKNITSTATISALKEIFARFGNPDTLVSDNGTQFTAALFEDFCLSRGIKHIKSPPYHPQSNGQAERFVDTVKRALSKNRPNESLDETLQTFLEAYRSTPCTSSPDGKSPAETFIGHKMKIPLGNILPRKPEKNASHNLKMKQQFDLKHGTKPVKFVIGDLVYFSVYKAGTNKVEWTPGQIIQKKGKVMYYVKEESLYDTLVPNNQPSFLSGKVHVRHRNQIRHRTGREIPPALPKKPTVWTYDLIQDLDFYGPSVSTWQPTPAPPNSPKDDQELERHSDPGTDIPPQEDPDDLNESFHTLFQRSMSFGPPPAETSLMEVDSTIVEEPEPSMSTQPEMLPETTQPRISSRIRLAPARLQVDPASKQTYDESRS